MTKAGAARPRGGTGVMANRAAGSLSTANHFPTAPWATRAATHFLEGELGLGPFHLASCWEPACGGMHMAEPLADAFGLVWASDLFEYPEQGWPFPGPANLVGPFRHDFLDPDGPPSAVRRPDWVWTNPPFSLADKFLARALRIATRGVVIVARTGYVDGITRFERLWSVRPPTFVCQFVERVPMHLGGWDPEGSTATHYALFVWDLEQPPLAPVFPGERAGTNFVWVPPGQKALFHRPADVVRWWQRPPSQAAKAKRRAAA